MYRDEHEAALRRADALQREVEELRARAETHDGTARRLDALERDIGEARAQLYADARRVADMERRLRELRGDTAPPTRRIVAPVPPLRRAGAGHLVAAAAVTATFVSAAAGFMALTRGHAAVAPPEAALAPDEGPPDAAEAGEAALADPADSAGLDVALSDDGFAGRPRHERALADYEKGLRLLHKGHWSAAREAFEAAIGVYPVLAGPHRELARLLAADGNADDACAEFATYLSMVPTGDEETVKREASRLGDGETCDLYTGEMESDGVLERQVP